MDFGQRGRTNFALRINIFIRNLVELRWERKSYVDDLVRRFHFRSMSGKEREEEIECIGAVHTTLSWPKTYARWKWILRKMFANNKCLEQTITANKANSAGGSTNKLISPCNTYWIHCMRWCAQTRFERTKMELTKWQKR